MIVVKDVNKCLGNKQILKDISFHISTGEVVGLIGKNGAGKTTLLKVLTGQLREDSGFVRVNHRKNLFSHYDELKEVAFVSGERSQLWKDMKLQYSYDNCGKMYDLKKEYKDRLHYLTDRFGIQECLDKPVYMLSLGQKMRAEIVYALLPSPKLLIMDEAMVGLDVSVKEDITNLLIELRNKTDTTILYTTHNLLEIERICSRVILLDRGKILFDDSVDRIMGTYSAYYTMHLTISGQLPDMEDLPVEKMILENQHVTIQYDRKIGRAHV